MPLPTNKPTHQPPFLKKIPFPCFTNNSEITENDHAPVSFRVSFGYG